MQIVIMSSACSSVRKVQSGVIQGSVVGPTHFNLFINDLRKVIYHIELFIFADVGKGLAKISTHYCALIEAVD